MGARLGPSRLPKLTPIEAFVVDALGGWENFCFAHHVTQASDEGEKKASSAAFFVAERTTTEATEATAVRLTPSEKAVLSSYGGYSSFLNLHSLSPNSASDIAYGLQLLRDLAAPHPFDPERQPTLAKQAADHARSPKKAEEERDKEKRRLEKKREGERTYHWISANY
ncbi:hypothetical protein JCM8547_003915 [Rhodosporidiobolus lusitaniae]